MSPRDLPWVRWFPGRFLVEVRGMSPAEIGLYAALVNMILEHGGPIDARQERRLARACGATLPTFRRLLAGLVESGKIVAEGDFLSHAGAVEILAERARFSHAQRDKADRRWAKIASKNNGHGMPRQMPSRSQIHKQKEEKEEKPVPPVEIPLAAVRPDTAAFNTIRALAEAPLLVQEPEPRRQVHVSDALRRTLGKG